MTVYTVHIQAVTVDRPHTTEYNRVYGVYTSYEKADAAIVDIAGENDLDVMYDVYEWICTEDEEQYFISATIQKVEVQ